MTGSESVLFGGSDTGRNTTCVGIQANLMCIQKFSVSWTMAAKFGPCPTECRLADVRPDRCSETEDSQRKLDQSRRVAVTSSHRRTDAYYCQKDYYVQLRTVTVLLDSNFYFADISSCEAKQILHSCNVGTFLIRDSSDSRYLYTISVKTKRGPTSIRISYEHGRFSLDSDEKSKHQMLQFTSIMDLIDFYVRDSNRRHVGKCRFLDKSGRKDLPIILSTPKLKQVPSLKHICRTSINGSLYAGGSTEVLQQIDRLPVPKPLRSYLKDYPYTC